MSVLYTVAADYVPTQVFDLYILSLENVPGWWVNLSTMKPTLDSIIQDLEDRNPGLQFRVHWITRLAYGRDLSYTPYINAVTYTENSPAFPNVYFYPGLTKNDSSQDINYFEPNNFLGRINVDGTVANPSSYSLADQFNHAVRYPDEVNMYNIAVASAVAQGLAPPEVSLRMLLEEMNSSPNLLTNMLLINLHGELIPLPPMRNYSDAARVGPNWSGFTGTEHWRAVSHPGQLQYPSGNAVTVRVYSYVTNPNSVADGTVLPTMTVYFPTIGLNAANVTVRISSGSSSADYTWGNANSGTDYTFSNPTAGSTLITLNNSPLRHPRFAASNRGLSTSQRLYGLEYIPCPVANSTTPEFQEANEGLALVGTVPKNTARWVIQIAAGAMANGQYPIETRMGTDYTTGISTNQPTNLSRTYTWVGTTPPTTELYQFLGDPRHMPYSDVKANNGYNWYFLQVPAAYAGYGKSVNGWNGNGGQLNYDVPRFFQILRQGLLNTEGLWTTMTGYTAYYTGIGGEFGADAANGFSNGLQILEKPWNPGGGGMASVDEITNNNYGAGTQNSARLVGLVDTSWFAMPWLGELHADADFASWNTNGNVPTGTSANNYYRANYTDFQSTFSYNPVKRTSEKGSASLLNGNPNQDNTQTYFNHSYNGVTGNIQNAGNFMAQIFNFPLPASINATRPFALNVTGSGQLPPEWADVTYSSLRTKTSMMEEYFNASIGSPWVSSALLKVQFSSAAAAYLVENGVSNMSNFGSNEIGKMCTMSMVRGFMTAGLPSTSTVRIPQLPLVSVSSPTRSAQYTAPSTIPVVWTSAWTRWDTNLYTEAYSVGFNESTTLYANVKYSTDNGKTWYFAQDNTSATAGVGDPAAGHVAVSPYNWDVSNAGAFPRGNYIVRVEEYRTSRTLHYAYHQRQVYINR